MILQPTTAPGQEHMQMLEKIFDHFPNISLTLSLVKCELGKAVVTFLGKQVGQVQVCSVAAKVQDILDFPVPQTHCELGHFLGMAGYYRVFCKTFSDVVPPLTSQASRKTTLQWFEWFQFTFEAVKALLCSTAPNFACLFIPAYSSKRMTLAGR